MRNPGSGLGTRIITAIILLVVVFTLIWTPGLQWGFAVFVVIIAAAGIREFYAMAQAKGYHPKTTAGILLGIPVVAAAVQGEFIWVNAALVAAIILATFIHVIRPPVTIADLTTTLFGLVYVAWFPAHLVLLHSFDTVGPGLVMVLIVAVALTDIGAYFVGRSIGKHKLAPVISPNKTWEGAIGGFIVTMIGMAAVYGIARKYDVAALPDWSIARYLVVGAILSIAGQVGDLTESAFKRDAGIKDSGKLFPGHGGALDRCDGLLFGAPALYYLALL
ncbi:MAG: hypothetical protein COA73_15930 [Candidatus Hydrogenedentota bacterium]|nr:MAG: hypothetical protein COA73_15930 [Candidatus Hydrogenedentota bacterium]